MKDTDRDRERDKETESSRHTVTILHASVMWSQTNTATFSTESGSPRISDVT